LKKLFRSFFKSKKSSTQEEESEIEYKYLPKKDELVDLNKNMNFLQKETIGYIAIER